MVIDTDHGGLNDYMVDRTMSAQALALPDRELAWLLWTLSRSRRPCLRTACFSLRCLEWCARIRGHLQDHPADDIQGFSLAVAILYDRNLRAAPRFF
ncbi:unnamed protein product [Lasius platythorax]|uniref:Uncharacterized protein n=1 Tax=Lasius platythorax TaxID=488582 RepID=A0AAV2NEN9_9HYME